VFTTSMARVGKSVARRMRLRRKSSGSCARISVPESEDGPEARDDAAVGRQSTWSPTGAFAGDIAQTTARGSGLGCGDDGVVRAGEAAWSWCACVHRLGLLYQNRSAPSTANLLETKSKFQSGPAQMTWPPIGPAAGTVRWQWQDHTSNAPLISKQTVAQTSFVGREFNFLIYFGTFGQHVAVSAQPPRVLR
jgi:hypothetical protein